MLIMKTEDAVGQVLCHDITQIVKGVTKDAIFRKGHIIKPEDIEILLSLGKDHVYIWENDETKLHENEAAEILKEICKGENISSSEVKEGKIELIAACDGIFTIDIDGVNKINSLGNMMIATRHGGYPVKKGDKLAGTRIIPLVIDVDIMEKAKIQAGPKPLLNVIPFKTKTYGVITTGNEIYHKRIDDTFTPVIIEKMSEYNANIKIHKIVDDDFEKITQIIKDMFQSGVDMVICTGGMSVDPDDRTPLAIKNTGAKMVSYGAPVLPGAMFVLAYYDNKPILGLPGCVMYSKRTIFDLVLPPLMADLPVTNEMLSNFGVGGLCLNCTPCTYPNCGFGK